MTRFFPPHNHQPIDLTPDISLSALRARRIRRRLIPARTAAAGQIGITAAEIAQSAGLAVRQGEGL